MSCPSAWGPLRRQARNVHAGICGGRWPTKGLTPISGPIEGVRQGRGSDHVTLRASSAAGRAHETAQPLPTTWQHAVAAQCDADVPVISCEATVAIA